MTRPDAHCQMTRSTIAGSSRSTMPRMCERAEPRRVSGIGICSDGFGRRPRELRLEDRPDAIVKLGETIRVEWLEHVARSRKLDGDIRLEPCRLAAEQHDVVGQDDGLRQIVR